MDMNPFKPLIQHCEDFYGKVFSIKEPLNKALNTLNQLEKKDLCHSIKNNLPELGDVRIIKPPV